MWMNIVTIACIIAYIVEIYFFCRGLAKKSFKDMINYLATDNKITSVQFASIQYDAQNDVARGTVTLLLYLLDTDAIEYLPPDVFQPDTGKDNIYD